MEMTLHHDHHLEVVEVEFHGGPTIVVRRSNDQVLS
jgi:hypothetical protein